ncbi:(2Fe-2S) ferredoxin [Paenibacillus mucilaginosus]
MRRRGEEVTLAIRDEIARQGAGQWLHTTRTRCNGRCSDGCVVIAYPEGVWYRDVTPETGRQLVRELAAGRLLEKQVLHRYGPSCSGEAAAEAATAREGLRRTNPR